ncbi:MAG: hypothetical protein C0596_13835 [Marinilabiliales bacterium]|nr:MAG: hypothetical protein C0596_13835 [Marinilabiliales bacterium]
MENLTNKDKRVQSDCIKTLYETSYIKPVLIKEYLPAFIELLNSKNNILVWGSMIAIWKITPFEHKETFANFELINKTIKNGSVITIDAGVGILAELNKFEEYKEKTDPAIEEILWNCPIKQLAQYCERILPSITNSNAELYSILINKRISEIEKESQAKRLNKVLSSLKKLQA